MFKSSNLVYEGEILIGRRQYKLFKAISHIHSSSQPLAPKLKYIYHKAKDPRVTASHSVLPSCLQVRYSDVKSSFSQLCSHLLNMSGSLGDWLSE